LNLKAEQGRLLRDGDTRKVVLGNNFASDEIFGKPIESGDRVLLSDIQYEVVGILEKKGNFMVDNAVAINEEQMLEDFGGEDEVDVILVVVRDPDEINQVQTEIERLLRKERDVEEGEEDFSVQSPQQILDSLDSALFAVQLFVIIIASISLLVGGIGIMNTMYTAVVERTKDIGIMKAIGARNKTIFTLFALESGFLGMAGGIIGLILGLILAYGLAFLGRQFLGPDLIMASVSFTLIFGSLMFSFVIGLIAGLVPAYQASRMQPVEALRYAK
jgi:putative ABC transport system permease protein